MKKLIEKVTLFILLRPMFGWERSGFEQCRDIVQTMLHGGGFGLIEGLCAITRDLETGLWRELANEILELLDQLKK